MSVCPPPGIRQGIFFVAGFCGRNPASYGAVLLAQKEMDVENLPGLGGKLLWEDDKKDADQKEKHRIASPDSIVSTDGQHHHGHGHGPVSGHICVDVDGSGNFVVNTAVNRFNSQRRPSKTLQAVEEGGAYAVDLMQLVRDKIYQKYGDSGFYSALRRACLAGVGAHERFESLGEHGRLQASFVAVLRCSHRLRCVPDAMKRSPNKNLPEASSEEHAQLPQNLSLLQWRKTLKELGLQLTERAFAAMVQLFSPAGSGGAVPFEKFIAAVAGKSESHTLGLPSETAPNGRLVPKPPW